MKKKVLSMIILFGCMLLMSGCWDNTELNEKHVVLDVAVDKYSEKNKEQTSSQPNYTVTYSIPDMSKLSGKDSLSENVKTVLPVNSTTIAQSIDKIEAKTQNTISFSHTKAILLGEELMKDKSLFKTTMNSFMENIELGRSTDLLAVQGKAGEMSNAQSYQNPIIGMYVISYFKNSDRAIGNCEEQSLGRFNKEIKETGVSTMPIISENKEEATLQIQGAAVIKDYELVGWLDTDEIKAKEILDGKVQNIPIVAQIDGEYYMYELDHEDCKIDYKEQDGQLQINIHIEAFGKLTEYDMNEITKDDGARLSQEVAQQVGEQLIKTIYGGLEKARALNADYFHLSNDLYRKQPKLWAKYQPIWENSLYNGVKVNIDVNTEVEGIGMM